MSGKLFPEIQKCCQNNCLNQTWLNHMFTYAGFWCRQKVLGEMPEDPVYDLHTREKMNFVISYFGSLRYLLFFCNLSYLLIVSCRNLSISGKGETIRMYRAFNLSLLSGYRLREKEIDLDVYETLQVYACCFFKDKFLLKIDIKFNHSISK